MEKMRKPFQGVVNIVCFNWHFYVLSLCFILALMTSANYFREQIQIYIYIVCGLVTSTLLISLFVSYYVYDLSGFYKLSWLNDLRLEEESRMVNVNAGFDETSNLLRQKFPSSTLTVFDFYDPAKHTEISIKRARKAYPPFLGSRQISTQSLPLKDKSVDAIFLIFAAHEIRNENERIVFFKELNRAIKPTGQIIMTEHIRDVANFLAYNIGTFHFYPRSGWQRVFRSAELRIVKEIKLTPLVSTFVLAHNGDSL